MVHVAQIAFGVDGLFGGGERYPRSHGLWLASRPSTASRRIGGVPEVVVDGVTGFLVEPGDVDALHDRIAALLSDRRLARRFGDNARAAVTARFTWEACAGAMPGRLPRAGHVTGAP